MLRNVLPLPASPLSCTRQGHEAKPISVASLSAYSGNLAGGQAGSKSRYATGCNAMRNIAHTQESIVTDWLPVLRHGEYRALGA